MSGLTSHGTRDRVKRTESVTYSTYLDGRHVHASTTTLRRSLTSAKDMKGEFFVLTIRLGRTCEPHLGSEVSSSGVRARACPSPNPVKRGSRWNSAKKPGYPKSQRLRHGPLSGVRAVGVRNPLDARAPEPAVPVQGVVRHPVHRRGREACRV